MSISLTIFLTLIVYKAALIGVGLWALSRNRDETDFFLGGRSLGPWVAGLSYAASSSSAWVLLGYSGFVYVEGLRALWMVPGIWAGYVVIWLVFGPRLQRESVKHGQVTMSDFLFQDTSPGPWKTTAVLVATALILICFIFYVAAQFDAAGRAFVEYFPLSTTEAILTGAVIVIAYCILGGFWAVSATDTLQGGVMALVCVCLPLTALYVAGGPAGVIAQLAEIAPQAYLEPMGGFAWPLFLGFVLGGFGVFLGALGQPHLMSRLMAIRDSRARYQGFAVAISWGVLVFSGMTVLGLSGRALFPELVSGEAIFYKATGELFTPVLAGIVTAAILSAVMSTVDSILLAASAAFAHDTGLSRSFPGKDVLVARLTMLAIAALAVVLSLSLPETIFSRVLFAWSALGAAFGPIMIARIANRQPSAALATTSMLLGFGVTLWFYFLGTSDASGADQGFFVYLAKLPGDPFERTVPWLAPLVLLFALAPRVTRRSPG